MTKIMRSVIMMLGVAALVFTVFVAPAGAAAPNPVAAVSVVGAPENSMRDMMTVSWVNPAGNSQSNFRIQYSRNGEFTSGVTTVATPGTAASQVVKGLLKGVNYYFRVQAYNASGASAFTNATPFPVPTP